MVRFLQASPVAIAAWLCLGAGAAPAQTTSSDTGPPFVAADSAIDGSTREAGRKGEVPSRPVEYFYFGAPFDPPNERGPIRVYFELTSPFPLQVQDEDLSDLISEARLSAGASSWTSVEPCYFRMSTDAAGLPVDWAVRFKLARTGPGPIIVPGVESLWSISSDGDAAGSTPNACQPIDNSAFSNSVPGTWSRGQARAVPAMASHGIVLMMLSILFLARLRARRR
jgi:hypothetical protein